jgi:hypothetical protein
MEDDTPELDTWTPLCRAASDLLSKFEAKTNGLDEKRDDADQNGGVKRDQKMDVRGERAEGVVVRLEHRQATLAKWGDSSRSRSTLRRQRAFHARW